MTQSLKTVSAKSSYASFVTAHSQPPSRQSSNRSLPANKTPQGPSRPLSRAASNDNPASVQATNFASAEEHIHKTNTITRMYDGENKRREQERRNQSPSRLPTPVNARLSSDLPDQTSLPIFIAQEQQTSGPLSHAGPSPQPAQHTSRAPIVTSGSPQRDPASATGSQLNVAAAQPKTSRAHRRLLNRILNSCDRTLGQKTSTGGSQPHVSQTLPANSPSRPSGSGRQKMPHGLSWKGSRRT